MASSPISPFVEQYSQLSDDGIALAIRQLPGLPDEGDPAWQQDDTWMQIGYPYVALALIVGSRRMISAVPELFDRAAYGDPFEIMQSARTGLENAFVDNFESLGQYALAALGSSRAGTRYWAVHELGRLRNPAWLGELARMLDDRASGVREMARSALTMIAVARPESVLEVTNALQRYLTLASNVNEVRATERDLKQIEASRADRSASSSASKISGS